MRFITSHRAGVQWQITSPRRCYLTSYLDHLYYEKPLSNQVQSRTNVRWLPDFSSKWIISPIKSHPAALTLKDLSYASDMLIHLYLKKPLLVFRLYFKVNYFTDKVTSCSIDPWESILRGRYGNSVIYKENPVGFPIFVQSKILLR